MLKEVFFLGKTALGISGSPRRLPGVLKAVFGFLEGWPMSFLVVLLHYRVCSRLFESARIA